MSDILCGFGVQLKILKPKQVNSNNNKTLKQSNIFGLKNHKDHFPALAGKLLMLTRTH